METSNKFCDLYERLHSVQWKISKHILPKFSWREGLDTRSMIRAGRKMLALPHPPPAPWRPYPKTEKYTQGKLDLFVVDIFSTWVNDAFSFPDATPISTAASCKTISANNHRMNGKQFFASKIGLFFNLPHTGGGATTTFAVAVAHTAEPSCFRRDLVRLEQLS